MDIRKTMLSGAAVLAGGALGAVSRLLILTLTGEELKSLGARNVVLPLFPIDLVNIVGCLAAGLIMGLAIKSAYLKSLLVTGFLGAFTSFSAYVQSYAMVLVDGGRALVLILFVSNALLCLMFCSMGLSLGRIIRGRLAGNGAAAPLSRGKAREAETQGKAKQENS